MSEAAKNHVTFPNKQKRKAVGLAVMSGVLMIASCAAAGVASAAPVNPKDGGKIAAALRVAEAQPSDQSDSESEAGKGKEKKGQEAGEPPPPPPSATPELSPADQYCSNVQGAAAVARVAQQKKSLAQAQQEIDKRIKTLTEKTEEYRQWLKKREDFLRLANDGLMEIYTKMKPEAAAAQLIAMNEVVAAAIVAKLQPKVASLILSEMDASRAARLSSVLAAAGEVGAPQKRPEKEKP